MNEPAEQLSGDAAADFDAIGADLGAEREAQTSDADRRAIRDETAAVLKPAVTVLATAAVPNWHISAAEIDMLTGAYADVCLKYFPDGPRAFGPELTAVVVTGMVIAPRLVARTPPRLTASAPQTAAATGLDAFDASAAALNPNSEPH